MSAAALKVLQLRQLLADRFGPSKLAEEEIYVTGLTALDKIGIPRAAVTEIISSGASGTLLLYGLLHALIQKGERVILIDGADSFGPEGLPQSDLDRLLWLRCISATEVIKAADLVVRDGNIPVIILLLTLNSEGELRKVPSTAWHRIQMMTEKSGVSTLVFSARAQVGCAQLRLSVSGSFPVPKLHGLRDELLPFLSLQVERRRVRQERSMHEAVCCAVGA